MTAPKILQLRNMADSLPSPYREELIDLCHELDLAVKKVSNINFSDQDARNLVETFEKVKALCIRAGIEGKV